MKVARTVAIVAGTLFLAALSLRSAAALSSADSPLRVMRSWFPGHSAMMADRAMSAIGLSARQGKGPPKAAIADLTELARNEPLSVYPFLVAGASAKLASEDQRSERLFLAARDRDPRSVASRYFLADRMLRTGRIEQGLTEMAMLSRLEQRTGEAFVPAVANYARSPGAIERLRRFFAHAPDMRDPVLFALARDPANAPLVLRLAPSLPASTKPPYPEWQVAVVGSLATAGDLEGAEQAWSALSGIKAKPTVVDKSFGSDAPPPPFAWSYLSGSAGVAQVRSGGGLDVIYYGREPVDLARQLLNLTPGRYRLSSTTTGPSGDGLLAFKVVCMDNRQLALVALGQAGQVDVPQGCRGQSIVLVGLPPDPSRTVEITVRSVTIDRVSG